jgi:hypothetical protein
VNRFATDSPRALGRPGRDVMKLLAPYDPLVGNMDGLDPVYLVRHLTRTSRLARAERLAKSLRDPLERTLAQIEIAAARSQPRKRKRLVASALALDPDSLVALYHADPEEVPASAGAEGVAMMRAALALHTARDWEGLAGYDSALAGLDPKHPGHFEAERLRVDWRIGSGDPERAREAIELIDTQPFGGPEQMARRALAGATSAEPGVAERSLELMAGLMLGQKVVMTPLGATWALAALDATPESNGTPAFRRLRPKIEKAAR